ncbi:hypothetical protein ABW20_dc0103957 [Dactylellina cionopaga]|nr:hypothetical protein ABW20_dc0103957 [Dactylellina cionopaga]
MFLKLSSLVSIISLNGILAAPTTPEITKREAGAAAWVHFKPPVTYDPAIWTFKVDTFGSWDDDWGHGFLDNLRAKCGGDSSILDWGFWYESGQAPTWGHATFKINVFANGVELCVGDAARAASWAWGPVDPQYVLDS